MKITERDKANVCFACGSENPIGLKLRFRFEDGRSKGEFVAGPWHQSWIDTFHGGLVATLLDEAIGYLVYFRGIRALTARMNLRYHAVVKTGSKLLLEAELLKRRGKLIETRATATLEDGTLAAECLATLWVTRDDGRPPQE